MASVIEIKHYHPDDAAGIAEMWNRSQDEWGGGTSVRTAEQVRQEHENSEALAVFLAICDNQVVGYCSLCEYREDTGALYIQLLNVRPDFHGKKAGKMLVLRAVEETIRRGWPRVDLYTWSANLKAVPLYKKCGFFWEDREEVTHFMNFIPLILSCEAITPYLDGIDWYADSKRTIEVAPDRHVENGFHYYTYHWNKDGHDLRVEVERRGRGIRLFETEDYLLSAAVEEAEPVFGKEYTVQYRIVNKSGAPLQLELQGEDDRNIKFDWRQSADVKDEQLLTAHFFVGEIEEAQSEWRTCPTVRTRVRINGKEALLQVGVVPKFPVSLTMKVPEAMHAPDGRYVFYLDMENHYSEAATFSFEWPAVPWLELERYACEVKLEAKERVSLPIAYRLLDYGFYNPTLEVKAQTEQGDIITFIRLVGGGFSGPGAMLHGETDSARFAIHGKYVVEHDKDHNEAFIWCLGKQNERILLLHPSMGKPYSGEFSKKKPERVEWKEERGAVGFCHTYRSDAFPEILLHTHTLLYGDGTVKLWQVLENASDTASSTDLWVSHRIHLDLYRLVLPYEGRILEMADSHSSDYDYWDGTKISEPWIFARGNSIGSGLCWSDNHRMRFNDWFAELEYPMGVLKAGESKTSDAIMLSYGGFSDWSSFRTYALKRSGHDHTAQLYSHMMMTANEGNPFVSPEAHEIAVALHDAKQNVWVGEVSAAYEHESSEASTVRLKLEDEQSEARFTLPAPAHPYDTVRMHARLAPLDEEYRAVLFPMSSGSVELRETSADGYQVHEADNGRIRISAAGGYASGLNALSVDGKDWLDSGFPNYGVKSWWNPWFGGITDAPSDMRELAAMKEAERSASFVQLPDTKGNVWSGIRVRQSIQKHETYRGLTWDGYYMMLPGVPVLAYMVEVTQATGTSLNNKQLQTEMFLRSDETAGNVWLRTFSKDGSVLRYQLGHGDLEIRETKDYAIGREGRPGVMHVVTNESVVRPVMYTNKDVNSLAFYRPLDLPHGSVTRLAPVFFVFADDILPQGAMEDLRGLEFPNSSVQREEEGGVNE